MSEIEKPFARWENFAACEREMMDTGHDKESADKICGSIQARAEKGMLYKSIGTLEILKSEGNDLIVGGPASWEMVDPEKDYITTEAMSKFLKKFFALPPDYRNVSIDHDSLIIGKALLQYPEKNPQYFTHVHEKGMYLIAKIRDDNMSYTQHYRQLIKDGIYKMYSIRGKPLNSETVQMEGKTVHKINDIDPIEVAIVKEGMNPKAGPIEILKEKTSVLTKLDCLSKMSWEECIAEASKDPDVTDPEKLCGWLRAHGPNAKTADKPADLPFQQEVEKIFRKHFPNYKSDQK